MACTTDFQSVAKTCCLVKRSDTLYYLRRTKFRDERLAMQPSLTRTVLTLAMIIGAGAAPLSGWASPCKARVDSPEVECCGGCCGTTKTSRCGTPAVTGPCVCSQPTAPPVDPTQQERPTQRVEWRSVALGPTANMALHGGERNSYFSDLVTSSSWPSTSLQAVLCRWLI